MCPLTVLCVLVWQDHGADEPPCNCSNRVSIEYLSEGRYRLGDKTLFIRVRVVNTHAQCNSRLALAHLKSGFRQSADPIQTQPWPQHNGRCDSLALRGGSANPKTKSRRKTQPSGKDSETLAKQSERQRGGGAARREVGRDDPQLDCSGAYADL